MSDLCGQEGLRLAKVDHRTCDKLRSISPPWEIPPNPWDLGITVQFNHPAAVYRTLIESLVEDPNVDGLAMQLHPMTLLFPENLLEGFQRLADSRKPTALWLAGVESGRHEVLEQLEERHILVFPSPEKAIRALSVLYHLSRI